jgi:hypothetical protein
MYYELIRDNINKIIPMEIEILKQDYILFFTGVEPYDNIINEI